MTSPAVLPFDREPIDQRIADRHDQLPTAGLFPLHEVDGSLPFPDEEETP